MARRCIQGPSSARSISGSNPMLSCTSTPPLIVDSMPGLAADPGTLFPLDTSSSSASLPPNNPSESFAVPQFLDMTQLYKAYCTLQKDYLSLQTANSQLKAEVADLKLQLTRQPKRVQNAKNASIPGTVVEPISSEVDPAVTDMALDVKKWGRYFGLFYNLFVTPAMFSPTLPTASFALDSVERYQLPANEAIRASLELYEHIPSKYHPIMRLVSSSKGKTFLRLFREGLSAGRSTSLSMLRTSCAASIFGLPTHYFDPKFTSQRIKMPEIQKLLGFDVAFANSEAGKASPKKAYARFPPILCKNGDTSRVDHRFRNGSLYMTARATLFGKTSAMDKDNAVSRASSFYLGSDKPAKTTFGLIANICGFCRYILSSDKSFGGSGIGPDTKIDYNAEINYYKMYLTQLHANPTTAGYVVRLLKEWDSEVFAVNISAHGQSGQDSDGEVIELDQAAEIERDMERLHLEEESEFAVSAHSDTFDGEDFDETEDADNDIDGQNTRSLLVPIRGTTEAEHFNNFEEETHHDGARPLNEQPRSNLTLDSDINIIDPTTINAVQSSPLTLADPLTESLPSQANPSEPIATLTKRLTRTESRAIVSCLAMEERFPAHNSFHTPNINTSHHSDDNANNSSPTSHDPGTQQGGKSSTRSRGSGKRGRK
ncbi:hypothetical protein JR316_0000069 [Psilocybe cubensis]|uniref:Uncharacterized protein n=1 Tax=Psilocybe cubensis TaxID=181762 RepID=A0ACB8HDJ2_PSICU|nr:hypothetical protein JR316_0000069 [Psilocybe cubensis]KAH9486006.1 hypothetical protein JR316_0000069 [Psilocybe cubensis]